MRKIIAVVVAVVVLLVASVAVAQKSGAKKGPTKVYMLMDGSIVKSKPSTGFYVVGYKSGNGIRPISGVEGGKDSNLCVSQSPQYWLELSEGDIPNPAVGREPFTPLIRGCMTAGKFVPANREVICHIGQAQ